MKWFKTKEEKFKELQQKVNDLNLQYHSYLNHLHLYVNNPVIIKQFVIHKNDICLKMIYPDTPKGFATFLPLYLIPNLKATRLAFIEFKRRLETLNVKMILE